MNDMNPDSATIVFAILDVLLDEFQEAYSVEDNPELFTNLWYEEAIEWMDSMEALLSAETPTVELAAHMLKEAADFVYTGHQLTRLGSSGEFLIEELAASKWLSEEDITKLMYINRAWFVIAPALIPDDIFVEAIVKVHNSNMSKLGVDGLPVKHPVTGKVLKGPNYLEPSLHVEGAVVLDLFVESREQQLAAQAA